MSQRASVGGGITPARTVYRPKAAPAGSLQCLPTQTSQSARPTLQQSVDAQLQSPYQRPLSSGLPLYSVPSGARASVIELTSSSGTGDLARAASPPPLSSRGASPTPTGRSTTRGASPAPPPPQGVMTTSSGGAAFAHIFPRPSGASASVPAGRIKYVGVGSQVRSPSPVAVVESEAKPQSTLRLPQSPLLSAVPQPTPLLSARSNASPLLSAQSRAIRMGSQPCMSTWRRDSQSSLRAPAWSSSSLRAPAWSSSSVCAPALPSSPRHPQTREVLRKTSQPASDSMNYFLPLQGSVSRLTSSLQMLDAQVSVSDLSVSVPRMSQVCLSDLSVFVPRLMPADSPRSEVAKMTPRQWSVPRSSSIVVTGKQADSLMSSARTLEGSRTQAGSSSPRPISGRRQIRAEVPGPTVSPAEDPQKAVWISGGAQWPDGVPPWPAGVPWPQGDAALSPARCKVMSPMDCHVIDGAADTSVEQDSFSASPLRKLHEASSCESAVVPSSCGCILTADTSEQDFHCQVSSKIHRALDATLISGELAAVVEKVALEEARVTGKLQLCYGGVGGLDLTYRH